MKDALIQSSLGLGLHVKVDILYSGRIVSTVFSVSMNRPISSVVAARLTGRLTI